MSATIHHRDTLNTLIQKAVKAKAPDLEICLVPHTINYGKDKDKSSMMIVEVQVDCQHMEKARELMIELFETDKDALPHEIYFVPTPTNGTITYDLYYQHICIHHQHVHALCSFAITNIGNLQAPITMNDSDGNTVNMTFEQALLASIKPGTTDQRLFYFIEPTNRSKSDGRYLLFTHKDTIDTAVSYIH